MKPAIALNIIQSWAGLDYVLTSFEGLGFQAHKFYLNKVSDLCFDPYWRDNLPRYREEVAKEILSSSESEQLRGIYRNREGFYRSDFLDDLERRTLNDQNESFIHPCLSAYQKYCFSISAPGNPIFSKYTLEREFIKEDEFKKFGINASDWNDLYRSLEIFMLKAAEFYGFKRGKNRPGGNSRASMWFYITAPCGVNFCIGYRNNSRGRILGFLPILYWLEESSNINLNMLAIFPGLEEYFRYGRRYIDKSIVRPVEEVANSAVTGIWASFAACKVLADSIKN